MLLALVASGMSRDTAYRVVQQAAQKARDERTPLRALLETQELGLDFGEVFDLSDYTRHAAELVARIDC